MHVWINRCDKLDRAVINFNDIKFSEKIKLYLTNSLFQLYQNSNSSKEDVSKVDLTIKYIEFSKLYAISLKYLHLEYRHLNAFANV